MNYADLIQFDPIETVVQLREADRAASARASSRPSSSPTGWASSSPTWCSRSSSSTTPADNKGLLVVGNYGTGKSHLMAVISAIAEHADLAARSPTPRWPTRPRSSPGASS
jgi:predicted ATPase